MIRPPGGPPSLLPPSIPPPQGQRLPGSAVNPNILSAPPSIMRPREMEDGGTSGSGQSRVTIQAKPQIKSKMGDVTRFMPTALKVKRETKDQKGRIKQMGKFFFNLIFLYEYFEGGSSQSYRSVITSVRSLGASLSVRLGELCA